MDSSTARRAPAAAACRANAATASAACGLPRSGSTRYIPVTPRSAGSQVLRSVQSKDGVPERDAARTATPRSSSSRTTRRPVLPVAPVTRIISSLMAFN